MIEQFSLSKLSIVRVISRLCIEGATDVRIVSAVFNIQREPLLYTLLLQHPTAVADL